jgi:hypothetical protein
MCNVLIESGIPTKRVRLIEMCLNETYNRVGVGKHLHYVLHNNSGLKQGDASSPLYFDCALENAIENVQANEEGLSFCFMLMTLIYWVEAYTL